jgi:hypothetical protein
MSRRGKAIEGLKQHGGYRHARGSEPGHRSPSRQGSIKPPEPHSPRRLPHAASYTFLSGRLGFGGASIRFWSSLGFGFPLPSPGFGAFTPV